MKSAMVLGNTINSQNEVTAHELKLNPPTDEGFQLFVQGSSGSGKTHTLMRIIEQMYGKRPIFIADQEGDFIPLRKKYDFVIVGKGRDFPADPANAAMLARAFLENQFNIIADLFEEKKRDREMFLKIFLETLHDAPRNLWGPATIILDEFDLVAPEKGEGDALCTEAAENAAKRFRKRGFDLIMATQRVAAVSKTAISQSRNILVGLSNTDVDIKRSLGILGFTEKEDREAYRDLQRGEFYVRGPELARKATKIKVGPIETQIQKGAGKFATYSPKPTAQVKKYLSTLAELPKKVEAELNDKQEMSKRLKDLELQLREAHAKVKIETKIEKVLDPKAIAREVAKFKREFFKRYAKLSKDHMSSVSSLLEEVDLPSDDSPVIVMPIGAPPHPSQARKLDRFLAPTPSAPVATEGKAFGKCERAILKFLAMRQDAMFSKIQIGAMTMYSPGSGGFNNSLSVLSQAGLIVRAGDRIGLNPEAVKEVREILGHDYLAPEPNAILGWLSKLGKCERIVFDLVKEGGKFSKSDIGDATGYSPTSGGFNNALSHLCTLGLIQRNGDGTIEINQEILKV